MSDIPAGSSVQAPVKRVRLLRLNTVKNCRRTLARLMRDFHAQPDADVTRFRALVYSIKAMGELFSVEAQLDVVARLDSIDKRLDELKAGAK
jgi:hypothetical protein